MKYYFFDYFTSYIPFKKGKHGIFRVGKTNVNVKFDNFLKLTTSQFYTQTQKFKL